MPDRLVRGAFRRIACVGLLAGLAVALVVVGLSREWLRADDGEEEIGWLPTIEEGLAVAGESGKPVLIVFR